MHPVPLSRRKFLALSGAATAGSLLAPFGAACAKPGDPNPTNGAKELAGAVNAFANELHARLTKDEKGDLFFSPFSIETALAMTSAGARGETLKEMQKTLHLPADPHANFGALLSHLNGAGPDKKRGYELTTANAIWAMKGYPWRKEFLELTRKHYGAGTIEVDFAESEAARRRINDWVEKETKDKIKELIPDGVITALTRMVLANAIYFKGTWQTKFDKKYTNDAPFTRADGTKADVPLMHLTGEFNYGEMHVGGRSGLAVQMLELPYAGKELSMLVILPEKKRSVDLIAARLTAQTLAEPPLAPLKVKVFLPRFKCESSFSLKPVLTDLGMKQAFDPKAADFFGMHTGQERLFISHVLHKAFVDVNEEGTEAAAATAVVVQFKSEPKETVFRADRPFVFAIRDNKTGAALFLGRYSGPK